MEVEREGSFNVYTWQLPTGRQGPPNRSNHEHHAAKLQSFLKEIDLKPSVLVDRVEDGHETALFETIEACVEVFYRLGCSFQRV